MNYKYDAEHTFFTSDTHFNHANIIRFCNRPFKDVNQMNEVLIENWNRVISQGETVFHLGVLCFGGSYRDVYQLFGHVHTSPHNTGSDAPRRKALFPTQYDVGVDNNNCTPVSFEQVRKIILKQVESCKDEKNKQTII